MKVVNSWQGRYLAPFLATFLVCSTCQAATLLDSPGFLEPPQYAAVQTPEPASQQTSQSQSPSAQPLPQVNQSTDTATPATAPSNSAAQSDGTVVPNAAQPSTDTPQASTGTQQNMPAPIVRKPPTPATPPNVQNASPPSQDQQFNKDQQYTTPAAGQQLTPLVAGKPVPLPAPPAQPSTPPPPPVGTALAPVINSRGTAGSRVAGAAIAPAKQRRIRTFAIRAALVVGAAVAIGVVAGASKASPARAQ